jgi:hypothetical protein
LRKTITKAVNSGHGEAVLYAGAIGLLVSDIIPTPADSWYFYVQQKNKRKLENNEITSKEYWQREAFWYYTANPIWWSLVLATLYFTKGSLSNKVKVGLGVVALGGIVGVLNKNIEKDIKKI